MPPHPETTFRCWSCHEQHQHHMGISLVDGLKNTRRSQVCQHCWKRIPIAQRIMVMRMIKPVGEGGMGLAEAIAALLNSADKLDKLSTEGDKWKDPGPREMGEFLPDDEPEEKDPDFNP